MPCSLAFCNIGAINAANNPIINALDCWLISQHILRSNCLVLNKQYNPVVKRRSFLLTAAALAGAPALPQSIAKRPANAIRSIQRLFASEVEDKPWFYDLAGEEALDAADRVG